MNANLLSKSERPILAELEKRIERGLQEFFDVGSALLQIRDGKLHRETHDSFKDYCAERFKIGIARAHQLMNAAQLVSDLQTSTMVEVSDRDSLANSIKTERQARELAKSKPAVRATVLSAVVAKGTVTAAAIKAEVVKTKILDAEVIRKDKIGRTIPKDILAEWDRADATASRLRSNASEIKVTVERGLADRDLIFAEIMNTSIAEAGALYYSLSQIAPHSVCPTCQGLQQRKNCQLCRKRGWISKYLYNSPAVSKETKAILEKAAAK